MPGEDTDANDLRLLILAHGPFGRPNVRVLVKAQRLFSVASRALFDSRSPGAEGFGGAAPAC